MAIVERAYYLLAIVERAYYLLAIRERAYYLLAIVERAKFMLARKTGILPVSCIFPVGQGITYQIKSSPHRH